MRLVISFISIFYLANGLLMLAAPLTWYDITPGADHTGPANIHFIRDIGLAFIAASAAIIAVAQPALRLRPAFAATSVFVGGHAILHMIEFLDGHFGFFEIIRDTALIVVPALIVITWMAGKTRQPAESGANR